MPLKSRVEELVSVRPLAIESVSPEATRNVVETLRSVFETVIVPADDGSIFKLSKVLPPPAREAEVEVIKIVVPAKTGSVLEEIIVKFPATVVVAADAKVFAAPAETSKLSKAKPFVVSVAAVSPTSLKVWPEVTKALPPEKSTLPVTDQVLVPILIVSCPLPVPVKSRSPEMITFGLVVVA